MTQTTERTDDHTPPPPPREEEEEDYDNPEEEEEEEESSYPEEESSYPEEEEEVETFNEVSDLGEDVSMPGTSNTVKGQARKLWELTQSETATSFENWRSNLAYAMSLNPDFTEFTSDDYVWEDSKGDGPHRGLLADTSATGRSAEQKHRALEVMLGQIASYAPIVARSIIVKKSTSLSHIWQVLRRHYGIETCGTYMLDWPDFRLEQGESYEGLYQRLVAFSEDTLLKRGDCRRHFDKVASKDEELGAWGESILFIHWLTIINPALPRLVKQRFGTDMRCRTPASMKDEVSKSLQSLIDELEGNSESRIMRVQGQGQYRKSRYKDKGKKKQQASRNGPFCPYCHAMGKSDTNHWLSKCTILPAGDQKWMSRAKQVVVDAESSDSSESESESSSDQSPEPSPKPRSHKHHKSSKAKSKPTRIRASTTTMTGTPYSMVASVDIIPSPHLPVLVGSTPITLTMDEGAESNIMRYDVALAAGVTVQPTNHRVKLADNVTALNVVGEAHFTVHRGTKAFQMDTVVVRNLDADVLAGTPFQTLNDVYARPKEKRVYFGDGTYYNYDRESLARLVSPEPVVLQTPESITVWPGDPVEISTERPYNPDDPILLEPNNGQTWFEPQVSCFVEGVVRVVSSSRDPVKLGKHEQFARAIPLIDPPQADAPGTLQPPKIRGDRESDADAVLVDQDRQLTAEERQEFVRINRLYKGVFNPRQHVYNHALGHFEAKVNMGDVKPPQRKGRIPQYSRDRLVELQEKFDALERDGVFQRPEDVDVCIENVSPSFLVKKKNGTFRLVTSFCDVARFCRPTPSLMPDVDTTLRKVAQWRFIITTDLSAAYYQIPLDRQSCKYCGVVTPFKGSRVYCRCAMGLPGSESALEELMCKLLGPLLQSGHVVKLADDMYIGANEVSTLHGVWSTLLSILDKCGLGLSACKTIVCPKSTIILGWQWEQGTIRATAHRLNTLATCSRPTTVTGMRSFVGTFKVMARVIPGAALILDPLEQSTTNAKDGKSKINWTDDLETAFENAQRYLRSAKTIKLPTAEDKLWIVTDAATSNQGLGATLYSTRGNSKAKLSGFFSAKLRPLQKTWIPCEIEALAITASIKHFAPYVIQSKHQATILTDSKPCVQAVAKLQRGEFSASPRVTTFLATVARYNIHIAHVKGAANIVSDFASRNAADCVSDDCQICRFVCDEAMSVVHACRAESVEDVLRGRQPLPYSDRSTWITIQHDCKTLRKVFALKKQGSTLRKKDTHERDVKRYLQFTTISSDGVLLVVLQQDQFAPVRERIVIPRAVIEGLVVALHVRLNHPSVSQLRRAFGRHFFALDSDNVIQHVTSSCHLCIATQSLPRALVEQTSLEPPPTMGLRFACDVLKQQRQLILVLREEMSAFTMAALIKDERADTLVEALVIMLVPTRGPESPRLCVRTDNAPGFIAAGKDSRLKKNGIDLLHGDVKNINRNPCGEKAIGELQRELKSLIPSKSTIAPVDLAVAVGHLNSRIRGSGLSANEIWLSRDQTSLERLQLSDGDLISKKYGKRSANHQSSAKSKAGSKKLSQPHIQAGDIVCLREESDKLHPRPQYMVAAVEDKQCWLHKLVNGAIRSKRYRVRLSEVLPLTRVSGEESNLPLRENSSESDTDYDYYQRVDEEKEEDVVTPDLEVPPPPEEIVGLADPILNQVEPQPEPVHSQEFRRSKRSRKKRDRLIESMQ